MKPDISLATKTGHFNLLRTLSHEFSPAENAMAAFPVQCCRADVSQCFRKQIGINRRRARPRSQSWRVLLSTPPSKEKKIDEH